VAAAAGVAAIQKADIAVVSASFVAVLAHRAFEFIIVVSPVMSVSHPRYS
jgi:hypothetical protein